MMIKRLKKMGASRNVLLDVYCKQVRSVVEFASVVWTSGLTRENIMQIERVQKSACAVILGPEYRSYEEACISLDIETLEKRREQLAYTFATKSAEHPVHTHWFVENQNIVNTRSKKPAFVPPQGRTQRFANSPLPYLTGLLNANC